MTIICGLVWAVLTSATIFLTIWKWLPLLSLRKEGSSCPENANEGCGVAQQPSPSNSNSIFSTKLVCWSTITVCALYGFVCGYNVAQSATSLVSFLRMLLTFLVLACVVITDFSYYIIPNMCSAILLGGGVVLTAVQWIQEGQFQYQILLASVINFVITLIALLLFAAITRGGIGLGDIKITSSLAFICGMRAMCYSLLIALIFCAICSLVLLLTKKKRAKDLLPLGPFIWVAFGISLLLRII